MDINIREMKPDEAKIVQKTSKNSFDYFERLWVSKPKQAIVATNDKDEIIGSISYKEIKPGKTKSVYIDNASVDKRYHGQGIGIKYTKKVLL